MATLGIDFGVAEYVSQSKPYLLPTVNYCENLLHVHRVRIGDYNVKVNIFDMAGQSFFYEVYHPAINTEYGGVSRRVEEI